jgi:hypothetical protein
MLPRLSAPHAKPRFVTFWWRVVAIHMLTYFAVGLAALVVFDYRHLYSETELRHLMRPTTSPWVAAGPGLQFIRGTLFAVVLWPMAEMLISRTRSWLVLFGICVGFAILGPAGPAPGSIEGALFTTLPAWLHLIGLPEVLIQTAAFSFLLIGWCRNPARWKHVASVVGVVLVVLMSSMGVVSAFAAGS